MEKEQLVSLVLKAQQGDNEALNYLFNEFYNDLYYFALKTVKDDETALDVTQEAFVEIINTLGNLKEPVAFVTWAKQITYHQCTRYFKKKKDILVDEDEDGNTVFDTLKEENAEFIPDEALDKDDFKKTIMAILDELSEEQRSATMMYYFDEMSVRQIAEIQGVSEGTIKSRLNYARKAIKASVEEYEKKNGIKLHAVPFFPLFKWIFGSSFESALLLASAELVAEGVGAATGTAITVSATSATATAVATTTTATAVGIGAKIAALPLVTKIVAGVVATIIAIGGATATVVLSNKNDNNSKNKSSASTLADDTSNEPTKIQITEDLCGNYMTGAQKYIVDNEEFFGRYSFSIGFYPNGGIATDKNENSIKVSNSFMTTSFLLGLPLIPQDVSSSSYYEVWKEETMRFISFGYDNFIPADATWDELFENPEYFEKMNGVTVDGVKYILQLEGGMGSPWDCYDYTMTDDGVITLIKNDAYYTDTVGYTLSNLKLEKDQKTLCGTFTHKLGFKENIKIVLKKPEIYTDEPGEDETDTTQPWNFVVPSGCTYTAADGTTYNAGDCIEPHPSKGDKLITKDYVYTYNHLLMAATYTHDDDSQYVSWGEASSVIINWGVVVRDNTKTSYSSLLEEIGGYPLDSITGAFENCTNMITAPKIPDSVHYLDFAFFGCEALKQAPVLPENIFNLNCTFAFCKSLVTAPKIPTMVIDMIGTFNYCKSLKTVPNLPANLSTMMETFANCISLKSIPEIPSKTKRLDYAFSGCSSLTGVSKIPKNVTALPGMFTGCTSLTGNIEINASITKVEEYTINDCFLSTTLPITISGSCPVLADIAATANNGNVTVK